ncbi:MAG: hypothetical protein IPK52_27000 [Chloroflexi bacterium]|nr:hypothetical protein [Chloroflexota bacterium]
MQTADGEVRFPVFAQGEAWEEVEPQQIADGKCSSVGEKTDPEYRYFYIDLSAVDQGHINFPSEKSPLGNCRLVLVGY